MKTTPYNTVNKYLVYFLAKTTKPGQVGKDKPMEPDFKLYTIEEITEILKVTQRTVYNYIKAGQLKAIKIGKYWRIKHTDLQVFLETGTNK